MGNKNSSNSEVHGQATKFPSTEPQHVPKLGKTSTTKGVPFRDEYIGKPKTETPGPLRGQGQHLLGVHSEQQWEAPLDNDDTFTDFIRRSKYKIRTMTMSKSNVGWEQSHPATAPAPAPDEANGDSNSKENQKDQFSDFIQLAKKKLKTTSSIGKNSSFKRG